MSTQASAQLPAPFVTGESWFGQMASYVISRYVDAEVADSFKVNANTPYFVGQDGRLWQAGQPVGTVQSLGASGGMLIVYAGIAAAVLFLLLRK